MVTTNEETHDRDLSSLATETRCTSLNAKGNPCGMPPRTGTDTCIVHSQTPEERRQAAKHASAKSAETRRSRVSQRQEAQDLAVLTQSQWLARVGAENAEAIARKTVEAILAGDMRALDIYLSRTEGKVPDMLTLKQSRDSDPFEMDMPELLAYLAKLDALPETSEPAIED